MRKNMILLDMVEVASYKTPSQAQQRTYKDKTAPPTDWIQFLLDPSLMQQFHAKLQNESLHVALDVSAHVRSFLDLPEPLPSS